MKPEKQVHAVPTYSLYGESAVDLGHHFVHIETLDVRSSPHQGAIRPHVHTDLQHLLFIETGSSKFDIDTRTFDIESSTVLNVPARCVHAFNFDHNVQGWIVTLSVTLLRRICQFHPEFKSLLNQYDIVRLRPDEFAPLRPRLVELSNEIQENRAGSAAAVESALLALLVNVMRHQQARRELAIHTKQTSVQDDHRDSDADLVIRYKNMIESSFQLRVGAMEYATRLCVCHEKLRSACARVTGTSPLGLLNARRLLEAKRCLLYSTMSIASVAYESGFEDPAYFSRFFTRSVGKSPREYRLERAHHAIGESGWI
jgi:AraC family transcriptional activator of pobA